MAQNIQKLIEEYLKRANVDSIDKLDDWNVVLLYNFINPSSFSYSAYEERIKRSKKDAHELAELVRHCIKNNKQLLCSISMREGVFDSVDELNKHMSSYEYYCHL